MPAVRIRVPHVASTKLAEAFERVRSENDLPREYPAPALDDALRAIAEAKLPERDETSIPFFTLDPAGSMDLDQAMHLEKIGDGYRVRYAIADVPLYVRPGGELDAETLHRGETIYLPDMRIPLHPMELSEGAASLLPDEVRAAFVWDLTLNKVGEVTGVDLYRAKVRSVDRLDYAGAQPSSDGANDPRIALLQEIGELRIKLEAVRGGASLPMPAQEVHVEGEGAQASYDVSFRPPLPIEDWNAQISLMTGMAAADLMLKGKVGILRTMPAPAEEDLARLRRQATALGVKWPSEMTYGEMLRTLDRENPHHLALIFEARSLFRGAGYTPFDGEVPHDSAQAAVGAPYAHVTAPLRRLVDRFGLVICEALVSGSEVPGWVRDALPELPSIMRDADALAAKVDRQCVDCVEAAALSDHVGQRFDAYIVDEAGGKDGQRRLTVQLRDHAVLASASVGDGVLAGQPGDECIVELVSVDILNGQSTFTVVGAKNADG